LQGHSVCADQPWVNPVNAQNVTVNLAVVAAGPNAYKNNLMNQLNTPFHPNATGYQAIANTIHDYVVANPL
jgi:lysophospholipase L1-like esterase